MKLKVVTGLACPILIGLGAQSMADSVATTASVSANPATSATVAAAADKASNQGMLHFWFRDSATGVAVKPDTILLDDKMVFNRVDDAGRVTIPTSVGDHILLVKAKNYNDLQSKQSCLSGEMITNAVLLDPTKQPDELKPENIGKGMTENSSVVAGFIVDNQLCRPVEGATVEVLESGTTISAKSKANGFFSLVVPITNAMPFPDDRTGRKFGTAHFKVSKDGFGFEEYRNVMFETATPKIYQIELVRGGGGNVTDEEANRNNLKSGLFGKFNVEHKE